MNGRYAFWFSCGVFGARALHLGLVLIGTLASLEAQIIISPPGGLDEPPCPTNCPLRLEVLPPALNGWFRLHGQFYDSNAAPQVFTLQSSADLVNWGDAAVLLRTPFRYVDAASAAHPARFYRLLGTPRTPTNDWANQLAFPYDSFFNPGSCGATVPIQWTKFALVLESPERVYFQDSQAHLLHYDFASRRLAPFFGLTPEQFNAVSLRRANQRVVLGVILSPRQTGVRVPPVGSAWSSEYGIQFVGQDPYPTDLVMRWFEVVKAAVSASTEVTAFYMPAFEQAQSAWQHELEFAAHGIPLASLDRWTDQQTTIYSAGWAVGRLVFVPATDLAAAYADGRLQPADILLTDAIPAEVPYVAGIIALTPATPSSHVAILAQSYGVPFFYLADPAQRQRVVGLAGHVIALRTDAASGGEAVHLLDLEGQLDLTQRSQLAALKAPDFDLTPKARYGAYWASTTNLVPADARFFGGKAANFGLLRRVIPQSSPDALAFSFDLWDDFLDQTLPGGQVLRAAIQARLGGFRYPPNVAAVRTNLAAVRDLFTHQAQFTPAQQQVIRAALTGFEARRKIRFRSSTNLEDSESFTGAGLYDSYSGCLADDLDDDDQGPCLCDATEPNERGVFRALRKVFASFYNENAFLERLRLGADESQTGMAVLVHYSTPDDTELANGVATLLAHRTYAGIRGTLVTQPGAASATNPDDNAPPEIVEFEVYPGSYGYTNVTLKQSSALVPLGTNALNWPHDYRQLASLVSAVAVGYRDLVPNKEAFQLDLEYKKLRPDQLYLKQVREIPMANATHYRPAFLVGEPTEWLVAPGSSFGVTGNPMPAGDGLLAMHRLKSKWQLTPTNLLLHATNLTASLYRTAWVEFADGPRVRTLTGAPARWPGASFATTPSWESNQLLTLDRWSQGEGPARRDFTLFTQLPIAVPASESQLRFLDDGALALRVSYASPVPALPATGSGAGSVTVTNESVVLVRAPGPLTNLCANPAQPPVWRTLATNAITLSTCLSSLSVYGEPDPGLDPCSPGGGIFVGRSYAYVGGSGETRIERLLSQPLVLRSYYAQTLSIHGRTGHENVEELILDPWLEPGLSDEIKAELTARNIRLLYVHSYAFGAIDLTVSILGLDDKFRAVPNP